MEECFLKKKLRRSTSDRYLAGVCGGFARYFNLSAKYIRIAYLVFSLVCILIPRLSILPVGIYLILYLAIPQETSEGTWSSLFHNLNSSGRSKSSGGSTGQERQGRKILHDAHERKNN